MRRFLLYLAEQLARDPVLRARFHAALDALRRSGSRRPPGDRVIDHADPGLSRAMSRTAPPLGPGNETRARSLIWMLGSGLLLLWVLLIGGAYGLWAMFGHWAITQASDFSLSVGPSELSGPIASIATLAGNIVGPVLAVIGVAVSAVILVVTALAARLLGRGPQG